MKGLTLNDLRQALNGSVCMRCQNTGGKNLHHINHDRTDNRITNLSFVCDSCHRRHHIESVPKGVQPLRGVDLERFICSFDKKYLTEGGSRRLLDLFHDPSISLAEIGRVFGVSRERARQYAIYFDVKNRYNAPKDKRGGNFNRLKHDPKGLTIGAKKLRDWRRSHGYTQEGMSEILGLKSSPSLGQWERGFCLPRNSKIEKIDKITQGHIKAIDWLTFLER
jgi:DNA-binding XRE family transcriptional regulator